jgi:hypothetical protein
MKVLPDDHHGVEQASLPRHVNVRQREREREVTWYPQLL